MDSFKSYEQAFNQAIDKANEINRDYGLIKNKLFNTYEIFMLPNPNNRFGRDLLCQVITPNTPKTKENL